MFFLKHLPKKQPKYSSAHESGLVSDLCLCTLDSVHVHYGQMLYFDTIA